MDKPRFESFHRRLKYIGYPNWEKLLNPIENLAQNNAYEEVDELLRHVRNLLEHQRGAEKKTGRPPDNTTFEMVSQKFKSFLHAQIPVEALVSEAMSLGPTKRPPRDEFSIIYLYAFISSFVFEHHRSNPGLFPNYQNDLLRRPPSSYNFSS